jgi:hypothetical protein
MSFAHKITENILSLVFRRQKGVPAENKIQENLKETKREGEEDRTTETVVEKQV